MGWRAPIRERGGERDQAALNSVQSPKANDPPQRLESFLQKKITTSRFLSQEDCGDEIS